MWLLLSSVSGSTRNTSDLPRQSGVFLVEPDILDIKTLTWFSVCFLRPDEDVQNCLKIMIQMLKSGRRNLVDIAQRFLESLKKSKSLDWKVLSANF